MNRMDPVGMCFTAKGVTDYSEQNFRQFRPCVELGTYVFDPTDLSFSFHPLLGLRSALCLVLPQLLAQGTRGHVLHGQK